MGPEAGPFSFGGRASVSPIERAFFDGVDVADGQDGDEAGHAPENDAAVLCQKVAVNNRPRIHEDNLDIEKDEEHGHEVELHAESRCGGLAHRHAAFVSHVLVRRALTDPAEQQAGHENGGGQSDRHHDMQRERQVLLGEHEPAAASAHRRVGRLESVGQGGETAVFLAGLLHHAAGDEILQLLVGTEAEHFLAAAGRVALAQLLMNEIKELLELEGTLFGKDTDQLLGHQVRQSAGKSAFSLNRHNMTL